MKKKSQEMEVYRQRRYAQPDSEISPSTAIPRDTEFDLIPDPRGGEQSFYAPKAGNAMWTEKDRP